MDFAVPSDHRIKIKESEKRHSYLDLAREQKTTTKQWSMKVTVKAVVVGVLGTIPKVLVNGLEDLEIRRQVETIKTTAFLRLTRTLRRVLKTCRD